MNWSPPPGPMAPPRRPNPNDEALQQAAFAIQSGRPADAERIAGDMLKRNAGDLRAMQVLGHALMMQQRGAEAVVLLERVFKQARDPMIETQLGMALRQAKRNDDAVARFERAIKRQPPFPPAFLEFGGLLLELGRHAEAIDVLKRGLAVAPEFAELSLRLGQALSTQGDLAGAREAFLRSLAAMPKNPDVMYALARTHQAERDFEKAAETYRGLLAITPKDSAASIGLGISLLELGRSDEGLTHLRAASRVSPKMFGEAVTALVDAGRGRFWLRPSDAVRALLDGNN